MTRSLFNKQQKSSNNQGFIFGLLIIGLIVFFVWGEGETSNKTTPEKEDSQVVDDQQSSSDKPKIEDTYIVRVYETSADKDIWLTKQINNQIFWIKWVSDQGMDLHTLDPVGMDDEPNPQAESFVRAAKERDIDPPFWMHVKNGGTVLSITPYEESIGEDTWKSIIKKSVN